MDKALAFARQAAEIVPVYYVPGNHEHRMDYETLYAGLRTAGATLLLNQRITIAKDGGKIRLVGVEDPIFCPDASMEEKLLPLIDDTYTIVLSHRPEYFDTYVSVAADLVLTGHAHGGQFRLPFIGGIFVPNQGLFPKYDAGLFVEGQTHMIISRGLGNSAFPFRLNNRPEIVAVTLKTAR
jgi:predicted MPP superfamily phosphohydrolase